MSDDFTSDHQKALLDAFFYERDQELLEKLKSQMAADRAREVISQAIGIEEKEVLDRLMSLHLGPETVAALYLVPVVEVAWADGSIDNKERAAVLAAVDQQGIRKASPAYTLLETWLHERPSADHLSAWKAYVGALRKTLQGDAAQRLHDDVLRLAKAVAEAAGGILGLGNKVSASEQKVLDDLQKTLE